MLAAELRAMAMSRIDRANRTMNTAQQNVLFESAKRLLLGAMELEGKAVADTAAATAVFRKAAADAIVASRRG